MITGIIVHFTGIDLDLSDDDFRENERPNAFMEVCIAKGVDRLANPVRLRVTPLTVMEAESRGILNFTRPHGHNFSPSLAGIKWNKNMLWMFITMFFYSYGKEN